MAKAARKTAVKIPVATRDNPVADRQFASDGVRVETAPPASRLTLRAGDTARAAKALGIDMPSAIGETTTKAGRMATMLGPDEWMVVDTKKPDTSMVPDVDGDDISATDVSHRNVAFIVTGPLAAACLNAGCPRDLSSTAFPKGRAARTVIGKTEVVIIRTAVDTFRVECWRSFAPYLFTFLKDAARDAAL